MAEAALFNEEVRTLDSMRSSKMREIEEGKRIARERRQALSMLRHVEVQERLASLRVGNAARAQRGRSVVASSARYGLPAHGSYAYVPGAGAGVSGGYAVQSSYGSYGAPPVQLHAVSEAAAQPGPAGDAEHWEMDQLPDDAREAAQEAANAADAAGSPVTHVYVQVPVHAQPKQNWAASNPATVFPRAAGRRAGDAGGDSVGSVAAPLPVAAPPAVRVMPAVQVDRANELSRPLQIHSWQAPAAMRNARAQDTAARLRELQAETNALLAQEAALRAEAEERERERKRAARAAAQARRAAPPIANLTVMVPMAAPGGGTVMVPMQPMGPLPGALSGGAYNAPPPHSLSPHAAMPYQQQSPLRPTVYVPVDDGRGNVVLMPSPTSHRSPMAGGAARVSPHTHGAHAVPYAGGYGGPAQRMSPQYGVHSGGAPTRIPVPNSQLAQITSSPYGRSPQGVSAYAAPKYGPYAAPPPEEPADGAYDMGEGGEGGGAHAHAYGAYAKQREPSAVLRRNDSPVEAETEAAPESVAGDDGDTGADADGDAGGDAAADAGGNSGGDNVVVTLDENGASVRIQRIARGRQARKRVERIRSERAASKAENSDATADAPVDAPVDATADVTTDAGATPRIETGALSQQAAAIEIQKIARSRQAKKRVEQIRRDRAAAPAVAASEGGDATLAAEGGVGASGSGEAANADREKAAIEIQKIARGRQARSRVATIRQARAEAAGAATIEADSINEGAPGDDAAEASDFRPLALPTDSDEALATAALQSTVSPDEEADAVVADAPVESSEAPPTVDAPAESPAEAPAEASAAVSDSHAEE